MTVKKRYLSAGAVVMFICFLSDGLYAQDTYRILLDNGRSIEVSSYREEGDLLYYYKYGAEIGILKSTVVSITSVAENSENVETVTLDKSFKQEARKNEPLRKNRDVPKNNLSDCEKKLKEAEKNVSFYCGKSESFQRNPDQLPVSAGSIRQIHDTSRTCSYYQNRLEKIKKACN